MHIAMQPQEALAGLTAEFTGWHIWRGRDGRGAPKGWYATRQRRLRPEELDAGLVGILLADDEESLRSQLVQQHVIEERTAASTQ
jgi:hypothetical protein